MGENLIRRRLDANKPRTRSGKLEDTRRPVPPAPERSPPVEVVIGRKRDFGPKALRRMESFGIDKVSDTYWLLYWKGDKWRDVERCAGKGEVEFAIRFVKRVHRGMVVTWLEPKPEAQPVKSKETKRAAFDIPKWRRQVQGRRSELEPKDVRGKLPRTGKADHRAKGKAR